MQYGHRVLVLAAVHQQVGMDQFEVQAVTPIFAVHAC